MTPLENLTNNLPNTLAGKSDGQPTPADMVEATRYLWQIFDIINHWIRNSDTKAAAVLSANAILANAAVSAFGRVNGFDERFLRHHPVVLVLDLLALVTAMISVGFSLNCIAPKMVSGGPEADDSLIFFGHIARRPSARAYEAEVHQTLTNEEKAMNQISDQVWINSRIVTSKLRSVLWAIRLFAATLLISLASALAAKLV